MRRRGFLRGAAAAIGLAAAPAFIRNAFGDTSTKHTKLVPAPVDLEGALARARALGRSLLILVVPEELYARQVRGQAWGSFLMHGDPSDFNLLAPIEVVCAPMKEVARVAPGLKGEPWALLLELSGPPRTLDDKIPSLAAARNRGVDNEVDKSIDRQIAALGKLLRDGLRPGSAKTRGEQPDPATVHRLRQDAPPGSRWDKVWDCPPCGMAFTPAKSARFLTFFVKGETPPPKPPHDSD